MAVNGHEECFYHRMDGWVAIGVDFYVAALVGDLGELARKVVLFDNSTFIWLCPQDWMISICIPQIIERLESA